MSRQNLFSGHPNQRRATSRVVIGSPSHGSVGCLFMRVSGRVVFLFLVFSGSASAGVFGLVRSSEALSRHPRRERLELAVQFGARKTHRETISHINLRPNPALNPVRFALWTLRDKAAQRRLALR